MRGALSLLSCFFFLGGCSKDADPAAAGSLAIGAKSAPGTAAQVASLSPGPRHSDQQPRAIFETETGEVEVDLEVVSTPALIQRGLMHRRHLPPNRGMLFVFASDRVRSFWMKNTLIPLDMLFVRSDLTVAGIAQNTVPLSLDSRNITTPTRYVIEVNGGWTSKHAVVTGTKIRLENLPRFKNPPL